MPQVAAREKGERKLGVAGHKDGGRSSRRPRKPSAASPSAWNGKEQNELGLRGRGQLPPVLLIGRHPRRAVGSDPMANAAPSPFGPDSAQAGAEQLPVSQPRPKLWPGSRRAPCASGPFGPILRLGLKHSKGASTFLYFSEAFLCRLLYSFDSLCKFEPTE